MLIKSIERHDTTKILLSDVNKFMSSKQQSGTSDHASMEQKKNGFFLAPTIFVTVSWDQGSDPFLANRSQRGSMLELNSFAFWQPTLLVSPTTYLRLPGEGGGGGGGGGGG